MRNLGVFALICFRLSLVTSDIRGTLKILLVIVANIMVAPFYHSLLTRSWFWLLYVRSNRLVCAQMITLSLSPLYCLHLLNPILLLLPHFISIAIIY